MAAVICLECGDEIGPDDVNVGEGVAYCRGCGSLSRLSEILDQAEGDREDPFHPSAPERQVDPDVPPRGCAIRDDGLQTTLRASARSAGGIAGGLFATLFWNGIVSIFVLVAIAGTLHHILGSVPSWFPAPNFSSGGGMPLGMVLFLWIFLLPFIGIGLLLAGAFLTSLLGRVEVRVRHNRGVAFTGFGPFGWKRRFDAGAVRSVRMGRTTWKENNRSKPVIVIEADRTIRIGSILSDDRRAWLAAALRRLLV